MVVLQLICGLALFLYGMEVMGDALKKSAGSGLKTMLGKMTSNPFKGFLLGLIVTAVIQSSSATTVMVVGFVNSGTMTLLQSVGVIMGANLGTAVTSYLTALSGLGGEGAADAIGYIKYLKPDTWMPILALIGIALLLFAKRGKKKDIGVILLGFAVLMVGMEYMSASVSGLSENEAFRNILQQFSNPFLCMLAGLLLTVVVQSSSASIGILQSLTVTGAITYGAALPIIVGQNIGTCITAILSSLGANRNGKRAALIHLYFNVIGAAVVLGAFYIIDAFVDFTFTADTINMWGVAGVHTIFKILSIIIIAPFYRQLEKLAHISVKDKAGEIEKENLLDERLLQTPAIAVTRVAEVAIEMAEISTKALKDSLSLFNDYDQKRADNVRDLENKVDTYEDALGTYLVKLSACDLDTRDSKQITKLLHIIGDFERISDHAVNITESAEEIKDKKIKFSEEAQRELSVMRLAIDDILTATRDAFVNNDVKKATEVEPLEQVVDDMRDQIKLNHIIRLQKSECTIEHGFVLSDLLTNFERVSDHCSNIAGCVIEISEYDALDMHKYLADVREGSAGYEEKYNEYKRKYNI